MEPNIPRPLRASSEPVSRVKALKADKGFLWSLCYLVFLFMNWGTAPLARWLPPTLVAMAVFLPLYLDAYGRRDTGILWRAAAVAGLGFALLPFNAAANCFMVYAAVMLAFSGIGLRRTLFLIALGLALFALESVWLGWPLRYIAVMMAMTATLAFAISIGAYHDHQKQQKQAELKLSHDEVRRLGALAERERIGRDLHDLLGHTLSLIALKSELAMKLFDRDPAAARREIADVDRVARDALVQVRHAVTGIRAAGLPAELASARLLLQSSDVELDYVMQEVALPVDVENVLAWVVREAVTNIQRHARARRATIRLERIGANAICLQISDDGSGGLVVPGNGLTGMRERVAALGGRLDIESTRGRGTTLTVTLSSTDALPSPAQA